MATNSAGAADEKGASSAAQGSGGMSKLLIIISGVNLVATLGAVGILFTSFQKEKNQQSVEDIAVHAEAGGEGEKAKEKEGEGGEGGEGKEGAKKKSLNFGKMIALEQFTINLSTPGSVNAKYARVNISLEIPTEDLEAEVNSKIPQVRNVIIDLFNSKRPADLATGEGREYLKEEIRGALNNFLVNGKIKGVFFTNFALAG